MTNTNLSARRGLPPPSTITAVSDVTVNRSAALAAGVGNAAPIKFRMIDTTQMDASDKVKLASIIAGTMAARAAPTDDNYTGSSRRVAKLSIVKAPVEPFSTLTALLDTLPSDKQMIAKKPPISKDPDQDRVAEERRNVKVNAFIYAASREDDNDFHVIIGTDVNDEVEVYMNVEISGLPPRRAASFAALKAAREAFVEGVGGAPPQTYRFYDPVIPVVIEGSLFWDASHKKPPRPGPQSLRNKIKSVWEIHPVSSIQFR